MAIVLTGVDVRATYTARSDDDGRYEFPGVAAGAYRIDIRYPDVVPVSGVLMVQAGRELTSDISTLFNVQLGLALRGASADALRRWMSGGPTPSSPLEWECTLNRGPSSVRPGQLGAGRDGAVSVVQVVMPLLEQPPPEEFAFDAIVGLRGTPGIVQMTGLIGSDGLPSGLIVNSASSPELAAAALTAVLQMRWEPARWRDVPVSTAMTIEIRF